MTKIARRALIVASVFAFLAVPVLLFWYGAARCEELACVGPLIQAFIHAMVLVPLLVLWVVSRRGRYAVILGLMEATFAIAMFVSAQDDFVPWPALVAVPIGLVGGWWAAIAIERVWAWSGEPPRS